MTNKEFVKIISKSLFFSSLLYGIANIEMSSKFNVITDSKDQKTLDRARDALKSFIYISGVWIIATVLTLYKSNGWCGAFWSLFFNIIIFSSITCSYINIFKDAAKEHNLKYPKTFTKTIWTIILVGVLTLLLYFAYKCNYIGYDKKSINIF